ncbi:unnamed protein product [Rangifer tarandus platyrhynchus]|uniref:Uncharacterized protein n=1 Tax=Rangifer tarandus platyrhynchus TaxID=3082113 RepID=A0ABN8XTD7_RANTA|nr:unnamed protein product [Rangifer tarandus platyrhynchus]
MWAEESAEPSLLLNVRVALVFLNGTSLTAARAAQRTFAAPAGTSLTPSWTLHFGKPAAAPQRCPQCPLQAGVKSAFGSEDLMFNLASQYGLLKNESRVFWGWRRRVRSRGGPVPPRTLPLRTAPASHRGRRTSRRTLDGAANLPPPPPTPALRPRIRAEPHSSAAAS